MGSSLLILAHYVLFEHHLFPGNRFQGAIFFPLLLNYPKPVIFLKIFISVWSVFDEYDRTVRTYVGVKGVQIV